MSEHEIDAALRLLDRQIVDREGRSSGKVDDVEIRVEPGSGRPPRVEALLTGSAALGARIHPWVSSVLSALRRLIGETAEARRIPVSAVERIGSDVVLSLSADELDIGASEGWFSERFVRRIPGAGRATE